MGTYRTEGIIIKKRKLGESDQIVTFFSKHYGKVSAVAKGIRKPTSKKSSSLELLNWTVLFLAEGRNLDIITETEVKETYQELKENLIKSVYCFQILELIDRLTVERQTNIQIFELLLQVFSLLSKWKKENWQKIDLFLASFTIKLLLNLGFWNEMEVQSEFGLSSKDTRRLRHLLEIKLENIHKLDTDKQTGVKIKEIVDDYTSLVLEGRLRSSKLIQKVNRLGLGNFQTLNTKIQTGKGIE